MTRSRKLKAGVVLGLTVAASLITIRDGLDLTAPAFLCPDMVIHTYVWILIVGACAGATVALLHPVWDRWLFAPRRQRIQRFQALVNDFTQARDLLVDFAVHAEGSEDLKEAVVAGECDERLRDLGIEFPWPELPSREYAQMIVLMERGGLREAQRCWPIRSDPNDLAERQELPATRR